MHNKNINFKIVAVIGIAVLILLGMIFLYSNSQPEYTTNVGWKVYSSQKFKIDYPGNWKLIIKDEVITLKPTGSGLTPVLKVETDSSGGATVKQKQGVYHTLKFNASTVSINGLTGMRFDGLYPVNSIEGRIVTSPLKRTVVFVENSGTIYTLTLDQDSESSNKEYDEQFNKMLSTLRFN